MGKLFNERTTILYQNPEHPKGYYTGQVKRFWILIPMCAYKVLVPYPKEKMLNLFQETILKLFSSGKKTPEWIAENLMLNISLVEFIIDELKSMELISELGSVTEKGKALFYDSDDSYDLKTGYVFYNYLTKNYADTFIYDDEFNIVDAKPEKNGDRIFHKGNDVSNYEKDNIRAKVVHAENEEEEFEPTANDILHICKKHKRRLQQMIQFKLVDDIQGERTELPANLEKVKLLGEKKYVYVATYVFIPTDDLTNRSNMQACYPFNGGVSLSLMDGIEKALKDSKNAGLKESFSTLKEEIYGLSEEEIKKLKEDNLEVDIQIKNVLSRNIENYPIIYKKLLAVERKYFSIQSQLKGNVGKNYDSIQRNVKDYIVWNYELLEEALLEAAQSNDYYSSKSLTRFPSENAVFLSTIAKQCGFTDTEEDFKSLFSVGAGKVKAAKNKKEMQGLLAYNLIIASKYDEHPFYKLAKTVPNFITFIAKLKVMRDDCKHPNSTPYIFDEVAALSIQSMCIIFLLLDDLTFRNKERIFNFNENSITQKNQQKIVLRAQSYVEEQYGEKLNNYGKVKDLLVALQEEVYLEGPNYVNKSSSIYEAILKVLCKNRMGQDIFTDIKSYEENKELVKKKLKEAGFELEETPYYNLRNVGRTLRNYRKGTLITLLYAWLYSEFRSKDDFLKKVALGNGNLIAIINKIGALRGHNESVPFKNKEVQYLFKNNQNSIIALLEVMEEYGIK